MIKIGSNIHTFKMSPYSENKTICKSGDIVTFETLDCFCNCFLPESTVFGIDNPKYSNPATGPLYIQDARCGDTLKIEIMDIQLGNIGVLVTGPVNKIFEEQLKEFKVNRIKVENDIVNLTSNIKIQAKPMIGVIGVAVNEELSTSLPGIHGGNLDCSDITKGSTVYLPIFVEGGLLAIGDLHALMGDGEIGECGLEIEGTVTVKVTLIKDKVISAPRIEKDDFIEIVGFGNTVEDACENASQEMLRYMIQDLKIDNHEASKLLCLCSDLKICQIVNQIKTVVCRIQKILLITPYPHH